MMNLELRKLGKTEKQRLREWWKKEGKSLLCKDFETFRKGEELLSYNGINWNGDWTWNQNNKTI
jgi:hypothetical protein